MLRGALRWAQALVPEALSRTWVLGYHLVGGGTGLAIDVSRERFVEQLEMLRAQAEIVSLRQAVRELRTRVASRGDRPRVVLTVDDAFLNFHEVVLPLLEARSLPATLYVPPGFINGDGNHPLYRRCFGAVRPMSWDQLRGAVAAGIEIGSHTYRHTNLARLDEVGLTKELTKSQLEIEQRLGVQVVSVCYPEGFVTASVARAAGRIYESGVVGGGRPVNAGRDLLQLPRLPVRGDMTAEELAGLLQQSVCLEEWAADKARRLRGRLVNRS